MNDNCGNGKILVNNYNEPETEERFPEFYKKIRESNAWMKHLLYLIIDINIENTYTKNDKNKAWNEWVDARKQLVGDLDEINASLCDYFVGAIIKDDHAHWKTN